MDSPVAVKALGALAHDVRLAVFKLLVQAGPAGMPATRIAGQLDVPASSMSFHLKELVHADLIAARQAGRFIIYSANFAAMTSLVEFLTESCCGGNPCTPIPASLCAPAQAD
jgi:DNA-binding transcriptional ArsR family regulator